MTPLVRLLAHRRKELRYGLLSPQPIFSTSDGCVNPVALSRIHPPLAIVEANSGAAAVKNLLDLLRLDPEPCMPRVLLHF
jgi:hypothetical protein